MCVVTAAGAAPDLTAAADVLGRAADHFSWYLRLNYRLGPDQVEPTAVPGYWQKVEACGPDCRNELHSVVGCRGPVRHTVYYADPGRDVHGRFTSRHRTWEFARRVLREEETGG
jgi:hypothetical protein